MDQFYQDKYGHEIIEEIKDQYINLGRGGGTIARSIFELHNLNISKQTIYNILRALDVPIRQPKSQKRKLQERIDELERQNADLRAKNQVLELLAND